MTCLKRRVNGPSRAALASGSRLAPAVQDYLAACNTLANRLFAIEDAAHMTIFSHPTPIAEAVDELWGGALRYEEEL